MGISSKLLQVPSSFHELAVVDFVFDVEGFLVLAIFPVLLGDYAVDLVEALGRERVRAEVAGEALDG